MSLVSKKLVIKVASAQSDAERCAQAFTVAATAIASGLDVSLWLTGEASWFAVPGKAEEFVLEHSADLAAMRDAILAGGSITLCTQCAKRRDIKESDLIPGVHIAGAASFVEEIAGDNVQALIY